MLYELESLAWHAMIALHTQQQLRPAEVLRSKPATDATAGDAADVAQAPAQA